MQISIRRKLGLWCVLCLSIFTAMTAIVKVAGGNTSHGRVDSAWAIFWVQAEASIAVIVVSVSAFRALFVAHRASKPQSPAHGSKMRSIWNRRYSPNESPRIPSPSFTGVRTVISQDPYNKNDSEASGKIELLSRGPGIMVTQDMSSEMVRYPETRCI